MDAHIGQTPHLALTMFATVGHDRTPDWGNSPEIYSKMPRWLYANAAARIVLCGSAARYLGAYRAAGAAKFTRPQACPSRSR